MTAEQATALLETVNNIYTAVNAFGYAGLGVLCGLVFAVAWRA